MFFVEKGFFAKKLVEKLFTKLIFVEIFIGEKSLIKITNFLGEKVCC